MALIGETRENIVEAICLNYGPKIEIRTARFALNDVSG